MDRGRRLSQPLSVWISSCPVKVYRKRRHAVNVRTPLKLIFCTSPSGCFSSVTFTRVSSHQDFLIPILPLHPETWLHILKSEKAYFAEPHLFPEENSLLDILPCPHRIAENVTLPDLFLNAPEAPVSSVDATEKEQESVAQGEASQLLPATLENFEVPLSWSLTPTPWAGEQTVQAELCFVTSPPRIVSSDVFLSDASAQ